MKYEYQPKGVCARKIYLDVEDGVVKEVAFEGGCDGNHKGLCALVKDMPCDAVKGQTVRHPLRIPSDLMSGSAREGSGRGDAACMIGFFVS